MTVASVIEFGHLASQLTDVETRSFINNLAMSNPQLIIQSLSTYFIHQSTSTNTEDPRNANCIECISNIIQSRDSDAVEDTMKLDSLPRRLIGACGSFLDQQSYSSLSNAKRSTYLGCSTPKMLTELCVEYETTPYHPDLDLSEFPFATGVSLTIASTHDMYLVPLCKQKSIALQIAQLPRLQFLDLHLASPEFIRLIANQEALCDRIRSVAVSFRFRSFAMFPNIEYLKLYAQSHHSNMLAVIEACRDLKVGFG